MAPGPVTTATLAAAARSRHAGAWIATGHGIVELPLIVLMAAGVGTILNVHGVKAGIGLAGGLFLLFMGGQLPLTLPTIASGPAAGVHRHPLLTGIILTGANPYFLGWWAVVGLALVTQALTFGLLGLGLLAVVHWLCDLAWLEVLSLAAFRGSEFFGRRAQQVVFVVCGLTLLAFGAKFLWDSGGSLLGVVAAAPAA